MGEADEHVGQGVGIVEGLSAQPFECLTDDRHCRVEDGAGLIRQQWHQYLGLGVE